MRARHPLARIPVDDLIPRFTEIRHDAGVEVGRSAAVLAEVVEREDDPDHIVGVRVDLTDVPFVTIDPAGSRDLDQAIHLERAGDGWRVRYAIADVAAHIVPGGAQDEDAWSRVETVYCPDMRVGLHPPSMAEGFASLLPLQRTKAVVWDLLVAADGRLTSTHVNRAWVTSVRQYSYDELASSPPSEAAELVALMGELGAVRRRVLREAGAVSLPKPSQEVTRDEDGLHLEFRAARAIEDDNAQVSLLTGMAAARIMLDAGIGVLRTMPAASDAAVERLRRQALALGVDWPTGASYADVLDTVDASSAQGAAFLAAAVSLFRGASWEAFDLVKGLSLPDVTTHGALAAPYAHVTAPLRRLVDRYGTEICLAHQQGERPPHWVTAALPRLGVAMVTGVRKGAQVDRACIDALEAAVLAPHVGEDFEAVGIDEDTIQLSQPAVVARCTGDVPVGERLSVKLVQADVREGVRFAFLATLV
ncbi:RNB domain-containing ribonuclease [Demequina sp. TTPB684]|uniref:RNB domain-containing ribonuclease n=1 Tax=unclassified Demequina TaxID=2620311 RepID=UPI001CF3AEC9|nr:MULTISPECIES: RNB domain-containing ribonuclease [unclassified Demequina]MCB2413804.1 RNB domain-containing ribonuclease [Demequina sp. TTPB684]UPU89288.1 RNB domain-containing ribonuclease [Demequina sp. TMPB413]